MKNYTFLLAFIFVVFFSSCEKVINVDLKNTDPRIVIEGVITDEPGPYSILLSKTNAFSALNKRNPIQGALVIIEDITAKRKDTLAELLGGEYITKYTNGVSGHTYILTALIENKTYTATCTMPQTVPFDSLYRQDFSFFGTVYRQFVPVFQDPPNTLNYYRFGIQVNDSVQKALEAWDDQYSDGKVNSRPLNVENQDLFKGKDTVTVTMNCTDKGTFDFFNTLINASGNGQTPANPLTNISGDGLGYFGAVTIRRKTIILKD